MRLHTLPAPHGLCVSRSFVLTVPRATQPENDAVFSSDGGAHPRQDRSQESGKGEAPRFGRAGAPPGSGNGQQGVTAGGEGRLKTQGLIELLKAAAKQGRKSRSPSVFKLLTEVRSRRSELTPQQLANAMWSVAKLGQRETQLMSLLISEAAPKLAEFSPMALATTFYALGKMPYKDVAFVSSLVQAAGPMLHGFKPQELANTVWALAKLDQPEPAFVSRLVQAAEPQLDAFTPQNLSNTVWALAKLNQPEPAFVTRLVKAADSKLDTFAPQAFANTVWALAALNQPEPAFVSRLVQAAEPQLDAFTPQNLSNTVWALAKLNQPEPAFVTCLVQAAESKLDAFAPQALANTVWALATLNQPEPAFVSRLFQAAESELDAFTPQALSMTLWALAALHQPDAAFVSCILHVAEPQLETFSPQALANTVWALATMGKQEPAFVSRLVRAAEPQLDAFKPQELASMMWSLAKLEHHEPLCMPRLLQAAEPHLHTFIPQALANMVWALATMGYLVDPLLGKQLASYPDSDVQLQNICNVAWAYTVAGDPSQDWLFSLVTRHVKALVIRHEEGLENTTDVLTPEGRCQLFQYFLELTDEEQLAKLNTTEFALFVSSCRDAWVEQTRRNAAQGVSAFQADVLSVCKALDPEWETLGGEYLTEDSLFSIDVAMLLPADASPLAEDVKQAEEMGKGGEQPGDGPSGSAEAVDPTRLEIDRVADKSSVGADPLAEDVGRAEGVGMGVELPGDGPSGSAEAADPTCIPSDRHTDRAPARVAIQADGPTHFSSNQPYSVLGHTVARNRALQRRGWLVLSVPFYEWNLLEGEADKATYLRSLLSSLVEQQAGSKASV